MSGEATRGMHGKKVLISEMYERHIGNGQLLQYVSN